jgi:hypothetical protein
VRVLSEPRSREQEAPSRDAVPHQAPSTKHQAPSTKHGFKTGSPGRDRLTGPSIPSFQYSFTSYTVSQYHIYSTISSKYSLLVRIIPVELTPIPTGMK